jgi:chorismate mutase
MMQVRGVRGATCAAANSKEAIVNATRQVLLRMVADNAIQPDDIASVFYSTTRDLNAEFPAIAARQLGWTDVPMMCMHEMEVPGSLPMCIRVMIHWNTDRRPAEIRHVYTNGAERLRPDLVREG